MVHEALAIAEDTGSKVAGAWSLDCSIGLAGFFGEWGMRRAALWSNRSAVGANGLPPRAR